MSPLALFLVQALLMIAVPMALWSWSPVRKILPLVVVQILAGLALGPSGLGRAAPAAFAVLWPAEALVRLSGLSWLAVLLFVFLTSLHIDVADRARRSRRFFAVALSSLNVPLVAGTMLGLGVALWSPDFAGPNASLAGFSLGIGLCVAVTALPVLGAILRETGLIGTALGREALGYAAVNDALLWVVLAGLLSATGAASAPRIGPVGLVLAALLFAAVMIAIRPALARLFAHLAASRSASGAGDVETVLALTLLLAAALATEWAGLHALIGAFAAGAAMPKPAAARVAARLETLAVVGLMPFYFIVTGLGLDIDLLSPGVLGLAAAATLAAIAGKVLGTALPARLDGRPWRAALRLGALMQCKGLMEVVLLTVLRDAGIIAPTAFAALLLMALATTTLTIPLARWLAPPEDQSNLAPTSVAPNAAE